MRPTTVTVLFPSDKGMWTCTISCTPAPWHGQLFQSRKGKQKRWTFQKGQAGRYTDEMNKTETWRELGSWNVPSQLFSCSLRWNKALLQMHQQFMPVALMSRLSWMLNVLTDFPSLPVQVWWSLHAAGPAESSGLRYGQQRRCGQHATPGWAAGCRTETSLTLYGNSYKEAKVRVQQDQNRCIR